MLYVLFCILPCMYTYVCEYITCAYLLLQTVDTEYTDIADGSDTNFNAYPILLIVVGCFILILGAVGFLGALCGDKAVGRVLLFVVRKIVHTC